MHNKIWGVPSPLILSSTFVNSLAMISNGHGMKLLLKAIPFKKNKAYCIRLFPLPMQRQLKTNKLRYLIRGASVHYLLSYQPSYCLIGSSKNLGFRCCRAILLCVFLIKVIFYVIL